MENFKALGLVDFHFFPHYKNSKRYDAELASFSTKISNPLYACPDGSGIIVNNKDISFTGRVLRFYNGKKDSL